jgi:RNA polymerase sigma-70 factor (ECF subfamily)
MSDAERSTVDRCEVPQPRAETFAAFFLREYPGLVGLGWALTGSRDAAEDVAQDAMTVMYLRWDEMSAIVDPRAYLRRICVNEAASSFRKRATEFRAMLRLSAQSAAFDQLPETSEAFWSLVRQLPRRQAQAVALYYGCDMSIAEVDETLEMAPGTVKAHLNRGGAPPRDAAAVPREASKPNRVRGASV